jgi:hypothetical protein
MLSFTLQNRPRRTNPTGSRELALYVDGRLVQRYWTASVAAASEREQGHTGMRCGLSRADTMLDHGFCV